MTQSYIGAFTQSLVLLVVVIISFLFLNPPKPPEKVTGIQEFI
jgi:hypothetical protein